ncbi:drug/metabolite transporter (DMT)-like permease [Novosphingobium chloroacetimidivorans]|uniref:Drug/metabolite transporter (DMT)-like permease n=1 Tax=Novosphingobium chloroacetimidivorans TaxID=1428314 RepID=A0A7W7K8L2_9SPHN|nr:DMT family transporter [Novosphingobium chloroacetimidivorans]MBB4857926.1 drug/metabolite transporter (DMT)-like permease [Novosphingobium chloroacetimidivorans]
MSASETPPPPHALLRPAIAIPFLIVALIWGSTWFVILGQNSAAPVGWSVTWRFVIATPAMFVVALAMRRSLRLGAAGQRLAFFVGLTQFCGNYNFVYRAEHYLTSGIVAVMIGLLLVPNTLFARVLLGQVISRRFALGSAIAILGIGLLLLHEARMAPLGGQVPLGVFLALMAMLCASISNVMQANETGQNLPAVSLLAWAMLYGTLCNAGLALVLSGPPVIPLDGEYWWGTAYLAIAGSVVTFPMYYTLIRQLGAGRAAYNGVAVIVIAMVISTLFEGYRWSLLAAIGAGLAMAGLVVALRARRPVA